MENISFAQQNQIVFQEQLCFIKQNIKFEWTTLVLLSNTNIV